MDPLTALSAQFDPLRPLEADETDLYVDWQDQLDTADDVKVRLANRLRLAVPAEQLIRRAGVLINALAALPWRCTHGAEMLTINARPRVRSASRGC